MTARLDVERPDPENRKFTHADPVAYTIENRGKILRALYTILLGNKQLREPQPPKTRFKAWWHLIGSALEHGSRCLVAFETANIAAEVTASPLDFGAIFREVEGEDEEAASLGDVLDVLHEVWPTRYFTAADVLKLIEHPQDGEKLLADRAKAFFKQQSGPADLSSMKVGKRLAAMLDTPIDYEGKTLKMVRLASSRKLRQHARRLAARLHREGDLHALLGPTCRNVQWVRTGYSVLATPRAYAVSFGPAG